MRLLTLRKSAVLFCVVLFCFGVLWLHSILDKSTTDAGQLLDNDNNSDLERRIRAIENRLRSRQDEFNHLKQEFAALPEKPRNLEKLLDSVETHLKDAGGDGGVSTGTCPVGSFRSKSDITMLRLFDKIPFDSPDGGVWKQGFPITYKDESFQQQKLRVFIVPHSHCDPGWIKTFEQYYQQQTRHILDGMVTHLQANARRKFIYAEMSFFSRWWADLDHSKRTAVRKLIEAGQLELVTGGWVMNDEANTHLFAMVDQMVEGHQWIDTHLPGVKPRSGWAIDPFGLSPTMAYVLKETGLNAMVIQRVHYQVKKELAYQKEFEFHWRQGWDGDGHTDMLSHMMPFYSYDIPHTCGPDPKICCQFDFDRLAGSQSRRSCPWRVPPQRINDENVRARAQLLVDQYKKKAQLYRNNVLLVQLGDDFRYDKNQEWLEQFGNYEKLLDFINKQKDWNIQVQFGTLADYFRALRERDPSVGGYPSLSGDFFTYSDRDHHYWSGYFTSRPFYKRLDRVMEYNLRGAEIAFSLSRAVCECESTSGVFPSELLYGKLIHARRNLGLFQHHDGITGTSKDFVVVDYGQRLVKSLAEAKEVMRVCAAFLMSEERGKFNSDSVAAAFDVDEHRANHDSLPEKPTVQLDTSQKSILIYNSLERSRSELVRMWVSSPFVEVTDTRSNAVVQTQIDPYWLDSDTSISSDRYKVSFVATVPPFGVARYLIRRTSPGENGLNTCSTVRLFNAPAASPNSEHFTVTKVSDTVATVENDFLDLTLSAESGSLQSIRDKLTGHTTSARLGFISYGVTRDHEKSGAYLFRPDGEGRAHGVGGGAARPLVRLTCGPHLCEWQAFLKNVEHTVRLHKTLDFDGIGIHISNIVDIRDRSNFELTMRISTDLNNQNEEFFTDLNGFQIQKRRRFSKLPIPANFYPMPTMAFIEDAERRLSLLTAQSLGVSSLETGQLEVVLDRRLNQDDGLGMQSPVLDNKRTPNLFILLLESGEFGSERNTAVSFPTLSAHRTSLSLIHRLFVFPEKRADESADSRVGALRSSFAGLNSAALPCDVHVLNMRQLNDRSAAAAAASADRDERTPGKQTGLVLHRLGFDCRGHVTDGEGRDCPALADARAADRSALNPVNLTKVFTNAKIASFKPSSLSFLEDRPVSSGADARGFVLKPMELHAFRAQPG